MDAKKDKKKKTTEDLELPSLENEIKSWCEVPAEPDDSKSAGDLKIDEWCQDSTETDRNSEKTKKK
ncbi:hypothetical protein V7O62_02495 [Methanolobus sp. ZRKC2]|uniref:hypothetical protein n=1 Tax=Methanolobus sp. ZRKC2 TaxID=3125783 RepID=UPI00324B55BB